MTSVWDRSRLCRKCPFVALLDSFPSSELDDKFFNQSTKPSKSHLNVILTTTFLVLKYTEKDWQQILKTLLKAQAPITSEKFQNKLLKAYSPNVYRSKFYIEYYNFCQQYENYFAINGVKSANQIFFTLFFLWD